MERRVGALPLWLDRAGCGPLSRSPWSAERVAVLTLRGLHRAWRARVSFSLFFFFWTGVWRSKRRIASSAVDLKKKKGPWHPPVGLVFHLRVSGLWWPSTWGCMQSCAERTCIACSGTPLSGCCLQKEGRQARLNRHLDSGNGPTQYGEAMDGDYDCSTRLWTEETRARTANAAAMPT